MIDDSYKFHPIIKARRIYLRAILCMTGMSQVRGENPQEAPSAGELHSDLQVSDREVWERRSNSESVA